MKDLQNLYNRLLAEIEKTPVIDIHTYVKPGSPQAGSLYEMAGYHFVTEELAQDIIKKIFYENPKQLYGV